MAYLMAVQPGQADQVYTQAAVVAAHGAATSTAPAALTVGAALTDNSGGTANDTIQDLGATYTEAEVANNFADVTAKVNALRADVTALRTTVAACVVDIGTLITTVNAVLTSVKGAGKAMASA